MSRYDEIKERLSVDQTERTYGEWIEIFKTGFDFSVESIKETFVALQEDGFVYLDGETVYVLDHQRYARGTFSVVRENFGFVDHDAHSYYVAKEDFNQAFDQDDVIVEVIHGARTSAKIIKTVKHTKEYILGTLKKVKQKVEFIPYDKKIYQTIQITQRDVACGEGDRVIAKITDYQDPASVTITSVLGQADAPGMDVLSVLFVHGIDSTFPQAVIQEAQSMPSEVLESDLKGRVDHRDQYVVTVDGEDAKDLDDAIYIESKANGYRLYIHIADVAHYVKQHSEIDQEAYRRTSSVYVVDRVVPMLPKVLSNGVCSLHPDVDRLVLTCMMDLDFSGDLVNYHIYESVIRSHQRLSYNQVNSNEDLGDAAPLVEMMLDCASRLQYKREASGSIDFDTSETKFLIDHHGKVLDVEKRESGIGEAMIEAFMVMANECVAKHVRNLELPVMYRVHEHPSKEKMQDLSHMVRILGYRMRGNLEQVRPKQLRDMLEWFKDHEAYPVVSRITLRSMSKARYSEAPLGHFGLALEDYTHFTSPIRRYSDLWLHQTIKKYLFKGEYKDYSMDETFVHEASMHISDQERNILEAERDVEKMKKAEFMQEKVHERFSGIVSGVSNYGIFVELPNTVEGVVPLRSIRDDFFRYDAANQKLIGERTGKVITLGHKVRVECIHVDMEENVVEFKLLEPKKKRRGPERDGRYKKQKRVS